MSEFDIKIGTQLDTSKAESQLADFIKKHSKSEKIEISVNLKGLNKNDVKSTEKSFGNVLNMAKQLGNIKVDLSGNLGKASNEVVKGLQTTLDSTTKSLTNAVNNTKRDLVSDAQTGISKTIKMINNDIKDTEKSITGMIKDFEKARKVKFIDQKSIDEGLAELNKLKNTEINIGNVGEVNSKLKSIAGNYLDLMQQANKDAFKDIKLTPLLDNLKEVREAMSAKNMDLSGIDSLIKRTNNLSSLGLSEILDEYQKIRSEFSKELKIPLKLNSIINAETAIKNILDYKDKLTKQITIETDPSRVEQLKKEIKATDEFVKVLEKDLGEVGKSTVKNLIAESNTKQLETLTKKAKETQNAYDRLGKSIDSLNKTNSRYIGTDTLNDIDKQYKSIGKSIKSLDWNNLKSDKVIKIADDVDRLDEIIKKTSKDASNLSIKAKVDVDFKTAEQMINGMYSALIKSGKSTDIIKGLRTELDNIMTSTKGKPGVALDYLTGFMKKINEEADNRGLKDISGALSQYEKYVNERNKLIQQASQTKDLGLAKAYKSEANQIDKALKQLESSFTQSQKASANALNLKGIAKDSQTFNKEVNNTIGNTSKLRKEVQALNKDLNFDGLTSNAGQKVKDEFNGIIDTLNKAESKLQKMLGSDNINTTELVKAKNILDSIDTKKLTDITIKVKCDEAIAGLKEIRKEMVALGQDTSSIDSYISKIQKLQSGFKDGSVGVKQITNELRAIDNNTANIDKLNRTLNTTEKNFKNIVKTIGELRTKDIGFVNEAELDKLEKSADKIKQKIESIDRVNLKGVQVTGIVDEVKNLENAVDKTKATATTLKLQANLEVDVSSTKVKINGLESALIRAGKSTDAIKPLKAKLEEVLEIGKTNPGGASTLLGKLSSDIDKLAGNNGLSKVSGDLAQYNKYLKEYTDINSKASSTNDVRLANKYKAEAEAIENALTQLESGFNEAQKITAEGLKAEKFDKSKNEMISSIKEVISSVDEYKNKMQNATSGYDVKGFTSDVGKGLADQFDKGISKADELKAKLNEMLSSGNIDVTALAKIRSEIESLKSGISKFKNEVNSTTIRESFDNVQIPNLEKMLLAVKEVMSAKNVDTSGIDSLIAKTKELANVDVSRLSSEFTDIQNKLKQEIEIRLKAKNIKTVEDILKVILEYRNELERQISMEIDDSKVKQLNNELDKTNKVVKSLEGQTSGTLGKALIDQADVDNAKQLESKLSDVEKRYEGLSKKADGLKGDKNVDISELRNALELSESIKKSIENIRVNPSSSGISKLTSEVDKLDKAIKNAENNANNIKLNIDFDNNLEKAGDMINGIEASLIKLGQSSDKLNEFRTDFESIKDLSKVNLSGAISQLDDLIRRMKKFGDEKGLGDISGTISQYKQLWNELKSARNNALKSTSSETANQFEQDASRIDSAMKRLVSSMKEGARESANAFDNKNFNEFSNKFDAEIKKVDSSISKFQSKMKNFGNIIDFGNLKGDVARGLEEEFNSIMNKADELRNKLKNLEVTPDVNITEITKAREELERLETQADTLKQKSIIIKCSDSISELDKLSSRMKEVGKDTSDVDKLGDAFTTLGSKVANGTADIEQATKELKTLQSQAEKTGNSFEKSFSNVGNIGTKMEGFFQSIKQSFSQFTIGELMADGIQQGVYSIKEVITELDSALADFARVAPDDFTVNSANLEKVASTAKQIAIDVGQSTSDVITGMSTALQAGAKTMEQATAIAKQSAIFQNVTDMSAEQSSRAVATMINQYFGMDKALAQVDKGVGATRKGYDNLTQAMDLANYAGNNFAISSEGVTQALSRGGSVLANYGVSIADSVALISSANESIQDPQRVGNGLKTIALNLSGMKTNARTGAMELNKTAKALKDIAGIDVFTDKSKTQTKDMMTLMNEIKGKWGELTDAQQKALSEGIAGSIQDFVLLIY